MAGEKLFENRIKKFLKEEGCYFIKYHPGYFGRSGIPDLLICCNGYFLGIEVKGEVGKPSELQLYNIREIKKAGGIAYVLYPKDFEKFKKLIRSLKDEDTN